MGSADVFGGSSSGGGSAGVLGAGGSARPKAATGDPVHDLGSGLVRVARTLRKLRGETKFKAFETIKDQAQGLPKAEFQRVVASVPDRQFRGILKEQRQIQRSNKATEGGAVGQVFSAGDDALSATQSALSAPGSAVMSTVAEATRAGGWQHANINDLARAAKEGFQHKRQDSISGIVEESTGYKLKGVAGFAADTAGGVALDPLTYISFGTGPLTRTAIRGSTEILGAERTAALVEGGMKALSAEEKARLAEGLAPKIYKSLRGVQGGVKVGPYNTAKTVLPGPLRGLKGAKIIEGTRGATATSKAAVAAAEEAGAEAAQRASQLHARADLAELQGTQAAGDIAAIRAQADEFDKLSVRIADHAEEVAGQGVKEATTAAEKLRDTVLGRVATKVNESRPVRQLSEMFVPRSRIAHEFGAGAAAAADDANAVYRGTRNAAIEDATNSVVHALKESGISEADLTRVVGAALDVGGASKVAALGEELRPAYDAIRRVIDDTTNVQLDAGILNERAMHTADEYLARIETPEYKLKVRGKKQENVPTSSQLPSVTRARSGNLGKRQINKELSIQEINAEFQGRPVPGAAGPVDITAPKFNRLLENPADIVIRRAISAHTDVGTLNYAKAIMKDVTDSAGKRVVHTADELAERGLQPAKDAVEIDIKGIGKVYAPEAVAAEMKQAFELMINDRATRDFLSNLDKVMTWWKGMATVPLPFGLGFHERNAMGNVFLNWLRGIRNPAVYKEASGLQFKVWRGAKDGDVYKYLSAAEKAIIESARKDGTLGTGFFTAGEELGGQVGKIREPFLKDSGKGKFLGVPNVPNRVSRAVKGANIASTETFVPVVAGRKFGSSIEENARLAHYLHVYRETGSFTEARRSVAKYLFDYGDLTPFERHVMKRFQAFYTFKRKSIPVILESLLKTPGKYSHIATVRNAAAAKAEKPDGLYPSYLPEQGGVPLPKAVSGVVSKIPFFGAGVPPDKQIVYSPDLPYLATFSELTPAIQVLAELPGLNKIPGLPKNPEGLEGAISDLASKEISGGVPGMLSTLAQAFAAQKDFFSGRKLEGNVVAPRWARLLQIDRPRLVDGKKQPSITSKTKFIYEAFNPLLTKLAAADPQGAYEQGKAGPRRISALTGQRLTVLDEGAERGEALRRLTLLDGFLDDLRAAGVEIESSRSKKPSGGFGG